MSDKEILAQMKQDCLDSLYMFAKVVCGFDRLTEHLHKPICDFLQKDPAIRKVLMLPRDHYKSTIMIAFVLWRLCRDPEERILLVGDTATTAQDKLLKIRSLVATSRMLHVLFPDCVPPEVLKSKQNENLPGSAEELIVPRKKAHQEPSIRAVGVTGARAGAHYTLIICDDLFTKEAKDQPATAAKIRDWADGAEALLELAYEHQIIVVGTPWHHEDVYSHLAGEEGSWHKSSNEAFYAELKIPFFDEKGDPIFPELYGGRDNALDFAERMAATNPYLWSANFLLDPQIPNAEFSEEDLQYFTFSKNGYVLYRPEEAREPTVVPLDMCEVYITVDPAFTKDALASKAAICVSAVAPDGNVFVLESIGMRMGTDALIDKICELSIKYRDHLRKIGVEKVGQQQSFIDYLTKEMRRRGIFRRIEPLPPGSRASKESRIRSVLQPYFGQRRVWLQVNQTGLLSEFRKFPLSDIKDELDALAYAADNFWSHSVGTHSNYEKYIQEFEAMRASVSKVSGY